MEEEDWGKLYEQAKTGVKPDKQRNVIAYAHIMCAKYGESETIFAGNEDVVAENRAIFNGHFPDAKRETKK